MESEKDIASVGKCTSVAVRSVSNHLERTVFSNSLMPIKCVFNSTQNTPNSSYSQYVSSSKTMEGDRSPPRLSVRAFWALSGPGWLVAAAQMDPSSLQFDAQSGAFARYELLFLPVLRALAAAGFQLLAARLGALSGLGLARLCRLELPRFVSLPLWVAAELAVAASCARHLVGAAVALQLLVGAPLALGSALAGLAALAVLAMVSDNAGAASDSSKRPAATGGYQGGKLMALAFMALLVAVAICLLALFSLSDPSGDGMAHALLHPSIDGDNVMAALASLGSTVAPHNLFLHSALVGKLAMHSGHGAAWRRALSRYAAIEVALALGMVMLVNMALLSGFAGSLFSSQCAQLGTNQVSALFGTGIRTTCVPTTVALASGHPIYDSHSGNVCIFQQTQVYDSALSASLFQEPGSDLCSPCYVDTNDFEENSQTPSISAGYCQAIGISSAGAAIGGALGGAGRRLYGVGLLASGVATVMAGAYASQLITEGFLLDTVPSGRSWRARAGLTRSIAIIPAVVAAIVIIQIYRGDHNGGDGDAVMAGRWLGVLDVMQNVQLPLALVPLLCFAISSRAAGGRVFSVFAHVLIALGALVIALNFGLAYNSLARFLPSEVSVVAWGALGAFGVLYLLLLLYVVMVYPSRRIKKVLHEVTKPAEELVEEIKDSESPSV